MTAEQLNKYQNMVGKKVVEPWGKKGWTVVALFGKSGDMMLHFQVRNLGVGTVGAYNDRQLGSAFDQTTIVIYRDIRALAGAGESWNIPCSQVRVEEVDRIQSTPTPTTGSFKKPKGNGYCPACGGHDQVGFSWPPWEGPTVYGHRPGCPCGKPGTSIARDPAYMP